MNSTPLYTLFKLSATTEMQSKFLYPSKKESSTVPLSKRVCAFKTIQECPRKGLCKCQHLDNASVCHFWMAGMPCDGTCRAFAHSYEEWAAKQEQLIDALPTWIPNPKYIKFFASLAKKEEEEQEVIEGMIKKDEEDEAEADKFFGHLTDKEQELFDGFVEENNKLYDFVEKNNEGVLLDFWCDLPPSAVVHATKEELAPSVAALFTNAAAVPHKNTYVKAVKTKEPEKAILDVVAAAFEAPLAAAVSPKKTYALVAKMPPAPKKGPKPFDQPIWGLDETGKRVLFPMPDGKWGDWC